jgi:hypothetical protein
MRAVFFDSLLKELKKPTSLSFKEAKDELEKLLGRKLTEKEEFDLLVTTRRNILGPTYNTTRLTVEVEPSSWISPPISPSGVDDV